MPVSSSSDSLTQPPARLPKWMWWADAILTLIVGSFWLVAVSQWMWNPTSGDSLFQPVTFIVTLMMCVPWLQRAYWPVKQSSIRRSAILTITFFLFWQSACYWSAKAPGLELIAGSIGRVGTAILFLIGLAWVIYGVEQASQHYLKHRKIKSGQDLGGDLAQVTLYTLLFPLALPILVMNRATPIRRTVLVILSSVAFLACLIFPYTQELVSQLADRDLISQKQISQNMAAVGLSLSPALNALAFALNPVSWESYPFTWTGLESLSLMKLGPTIFFDGITNPQDLVTSFGFLAGKSFWLSFGSAAWKPLLALILAPLLCFGFWKLVHLKQTSPIVEREQYIWNPLHPQAWYYGQRKQKLNQSLSALASYSCLFLLSFFVITSLGGCQEIFDIPAGGGEQANLQQVVKVKKVIKKKFIVNPFSYLSIKIPKIDDIQLNLMEITQHQYTVGYGKGTGSGFAGGTSDAKVRFIRLEYPGGDWNQDFGVGADVNILIQYGIRTSQKVSEKTESRPVASLKNFPADAAPPFVFMTGQRNISLSRSEIKILREYISEKHGMLFCDNGGSAHFHNQFLSLMRNVLPKVRPVRVPLDDRIHTIPYRIPFLPIVAPHGGKDALGWKVDGRWVAYYHPGDIADAWADGHAGVKPTVWEACYQLGTNIIFYAYTENSKWRSSRDKK